jgi:hypothetical protein
MSTELYHEIIYVKHFYDSDIDYDSVLHKLKDNFLNRNWGATLKTSNFRYDKSYFYVDLTSDIKGVAIHRSAGFIQGVLTGWLEAQGIETL